MNVQPFNVSKEVAYAALLEYKAHRGVYDKNDWEIERIYREIAKGNKVISAYSAIRNAGVDADGRPRLAIMAADQEQAICEAWRSDRVVITNTHMSKAREWHFEIPWAVRSVMASGASRVSTHARLPRIPPQHRPRKNLRNYQILWEADWVDLPIDPILLRRIGRDAYVVLAVWDLTEVELSVLRARQ